MNKLELIPIINKFPNITIGVIGDIMLDCFIWGEVERISPEAPIPIVLIERETSMPGGSANTAYNIVSLGGRACLLGLIGGDTVGDRLIRSLQETGIDNSNVLRVTDRKTTKKTRIVARNQQLLRLDYETDAIIDSQTEALIRSNIRQEMPKWNGVIISDYVKGGITESLAREIISLARTNKIPVIVDTKSRTIDQYAGCTLITPNHHEASQITGVKDVNQAGKMIQKQLGCGVLITQGAEGMTLFNQSEVSHLSAQAREIFDVAGAGDTVAAAIALAIASGATMLQAAFISNHAAAVAVGKFGTAIVKPDELIADIERDE